MALHLPARAQQGEAYLALNPQGLVPTLIDGDVAIGQSMAILEYLEEVHPEPPLLPADAAGRARVRQLAQIVACEIHPLNNLKVRRYLKHQLRIDDTAHTGWYHHWVAEGLAAIEAMLVEGSATRRFCHGDRPSFADLCLVPQLYNAKLHEIDLAPYPTVRRIDETCLALAAFAEAAPELQPDAE